MRRCSISNSSTKSPFPIETTGSSSERIDIVCIYCRRDPHLNHPPTKSDAHIIASARKEILLDSFRVVVLLC